MTGNPQNDLLIRACRRQQVERTPVWIMRQAGRYLPQYRAVREKADFLTMCRTPELAAEVTLQPVEIIGVDAAIIFSDILVIPEAMGMHLQFFEGRGPVFEDPLRLEKDFESLRPVRPEEDLTYVLDALKLVSQELAGAIPLIGFAGAPWTLAAYMIEGHGSRNFVQVKQLMYNQPDLLRGLLARLTDAVAAFLISQIRSGAHVVQLFDSWAGILSPADFNTFSLPFLKRVISKVKEEEAETPFIIFARQAGHSFAQLAEAGADVVGVSWNEDLEQARKVIGHKVALQGNVDPCVLFAEPAVIRQKVIRCLEAFGSEPGHVFNLGHGILPETPVDHARVLVNSVKEESSRIHSRAW